MPDEAPRYARSADGTELAYRLSGHGELDLVCLFGMMTHIDIWAEENLSGNWLDRLEQFARLIIFDERGVGMSDPIAVGESLSLDARLADLVAVLDAAGSERAHVWAQGHAAPLGILLAATSPERVASLTVYGGYARWFRDDDYPAGMPAELADRYLDIAERYWGTGQTMRVFAPEVQEDTDVLTRWGRAERMGATPRRARSFLRAWMTSDVRAALPQVVAPTLVIHRRGDRYIPVEHGRYLAKAITGAEYVELDGANHFPFGAQVQELTTILQRFVSAPNATHFVDRVMATVVFTDIVGSTEHATDLGDALWSRVLDRHDEMARRQIERFGGRALKGTGDGYLATFDLPGRAVTCARAICDGARQIGLDVRAGIHAGEIEIRRNDIAGVAVHVASRISGLAEASEVLVSRTVVDLVAGSSLAFQPVGKHALKGIQQEWDVYRLESGV